MNNTCILFFCLYLQLRFCQLVYSTNMNGAATDSSMPEGIWEKKLQDTRESSQILSYVSAVSVHFEMAGQSMTSIN